MLQLVGLSMRIPGTQGRGAPDVGAIIYTLHDQKKTVEKSYR